MKTPSAQPIKNNSVVITGIGPLCQQADSLEQLTQLSNHEMTNESSNEKTNESDWFDVTQFLGKRGHKYYTEATRLLLSAVTIALKDAGLDQNNNPEAFYDENERGVFVGTNFAVHQLLEDFDQTLLATSSDAISPMQAPNFSLNVAASYISINRRYGAFNISLTSPMVAGLEAVSLAAQAIRNGRAKMVIAAATESQATRAARELLAIDNTATGACALILEDYESAIQRGAPIYAHLGEHFGRFVTPNNNQCLNHVTESFKHFIEQQTQNYPLSHTYTQLCSKDLFSQTINEVLQSQLSSLNHQQVQNVFASEGQHLTVSPMFMLAQMAHKGAGLVIANSPYGHLWAQQLIKEGVNHD